MPELKPEYDQKSVINEIMGVGYHKLQAEFYFIFKDDSKFQPATKTNLTEFEEFRIASNSKISKIRLQYRNSKTKLKGLFTGVEFIDKTGKLLLSAGRISVHNQNYNFAETFLKDGESIIGVRSSSRG